MSFATEIGGINAIINNRSSNWNDIVNALGRLQELSSITSDFSIRQQDIVNLRCGLTLLIKDTRSKVVRVACDTISLMACKLKNSFEPVSQLLFFECMDKVSSSINGMEFQRVCKLVVTNVVMRRFIPNLLIYIEKRPERISQTAIQCVEIILEKWPNSILSQNLTSLVTSLCKAVGHYSQPVRSTARALITKCITRFPESKRQFSLNLNPKDRVLIEPIAVPFIETNHSKTSPVPKGQRTPLIPPTLSSYTWSGVTYNLGDVVQCRLVTGVYSGSIQFIGKLDGIHIRFGVRFTKNTGSKFTGVYNGIQLFECDPGYGAIITPSQMERMGPKARTSCRVAHESPWLPSPELREPSAPTPSNRLPAEECFAIHKLIIFNTLQDFKHELKMLEELESVKSDPKALEAYRTDMEKIIKKRQTEEADFVSKLSRVSL